MLVRNENVVETTINPGHIRWSSSEVGILKISPPARNDGCMNMEIFWVNAMMSGQEPDENEKSLQYEPF